jgi:hypothetical protein
MSEQQDDLELEALSRQLDDAFQTTRPRTGFEDELWTRMQARRPFGTRLLDSLRGLVQGIREVPAVPLAAVAAVLVVVFGVGLFAYSGLGRSASSTSGGSATNAEAPAGGKLYGGFGPLPGHAPVPGTQSNGTSAPSAAVLAPEYAGAVQLTWTGQLNVTVSSAPVFRYQEPTTTAADQFASSLGAVLRSRPGGLLGSYSATDYTLEVRGTVQSPPQSPAYFIYSSPSMPPLDAAGAGPADVASLFLAGHSLAPQWSYTVAVDDSSTPVRVVLQRQFLAPGYGLAYLVDGQGNPYGMELDVDGSRVMHVAGALPVSLDSAMYPIISSDAAIRAAVGTGTPVPVTGNTAPAVKLTNADLAYQLVPAGDHSFYEPVFVFSGTFQLNGKTYTKHVVVLAVDPSQRAR